MSKGRHYQRLSFSATMLTLMSVAGSEFAFAQTAPGEGVPNCQKYEALLPKGSELIYTPVCGRADPELGGVRAAFYKYGIGINIPNLQQFSYDLLTDGLPRGEEQSYVGQKGTFGSDNAMSFTYDLARLGLQRGAQLHLQVDYSYSNWDAYFPTAFYIPALSAHLPFFDDHLIVQVGWTAFSAQFQGSSLTTSSASGAIGTNSSISSLLGFTVYKPAPGIDIEVYAPGKKLYNHFGVQRSASPDGLVEDFKQNDSSLDWNVPGANALWINEVGYRVHSGPETMAMWMRGGVVYNESDFAFLDGSNRTGYNAGFYLIGDWQLSQSSEATPWTGWYLGAKFNKAREEVSAYHMDYGLTIYKVGPFESRPNDVFSVGVSQSFVSDALGRSLESANVGYDDTVTGVNVGYVAELVGGVYLGGSVSLTDHPTIAPERDHALNLNVVLSSNF